MEGSRHEKAALVLASYVIGFTTAFILYAQITTNTEESYFISVPQAMPAAVVEAVPAEPVTPAPISSGIVQYEDGRLSVTLDGETTLLSFNPEISGLRADTTALSQGFHYDVPTFVVSPAEDYVFFCEKQDVTKDACMGFVYDVATKTIYQVTKNGVPVLVSKSSAKGASWSNSGLTVGAATSVDAATPWELGG